MSMLGYRQEVDEPEGAESNTSQDSRRVNLIVSAAMLALLFLLEVLSWFTERGGVFSITSAVRSVHAKSPVLDIDENGLRFPIIIMIWLMVVAFARLFDIQLDTSKRRNAWLPILIIIGGGFIVDGAFGEPIITHYMVDHGYSRCEAGDWAQGNGKSRVWFADYILRGVECKRRVETVEEKSLFN